MKPSSFLNYQQFICLYKFDNFYFSKVWVYDVEFLKFIVRKMYY